MKTTPNKPDEYADIENELIALLKDVLASLPPNVASLEIKRAKPNGPGLIAVLRPQNSSAASVVAHAENGFPLVDFSFGDYGPTWELPAEGYNPKANKKELFRELEEMCRAVIAGNCEHKRGLLSIRGRIQVGDRRYKVTDLLVFHPVPPLRGTRKYEPYIASGPV